MSIVLWGFERGLCVPTQGTGFRKVFDSAKDADRFIQLQCNKIRIQDILQYHIYITDEYASLDRVVHYHNFKDMNHSYSGTEQDFKIESVDLEQVKKDIDLNYQLYLRNQQNAKMSIDHEVRNMSNDERMRQLKLFQDAGAL